MLKKSCRGREKFYNFLIENGFYVLKSQTNFLFVKKEGLSGDDFYKRIKAEGILIRHFNTPGIQDFVRITIGSKDQMEMLKKAIVKTIL